MSGNRSRGELPPSAPGRSIAEEQPPTAVNRLPAPEGTSVGPPAEGAQGAADQQSVAARAAGRPKIAAVSAIRLVQEYLDDLIEAAPDLERWHGPSGGTPAVTLYAAASAAGLRRCRELLPLHPDVPAVLYDLADLLGPAGAGLNGFRGYLPGSASEERLLRCLARVAGGRIDAPREHLETLARVLSQPPLDAVDRQIVQLLAWGRSHQQIIQELGLRKSTFESYLGRLMELLDAASGHHLGSIAQGLDLAVPFEEEPPDLAHADILDRPRKKRGRARD